MDSYYFWSADADLHLECRSRLVSGRAKMTHKKIKEWRMYCFEVLDFSFECWRLLLLLGRPTWRPIDKYIAIFYLKICISFNCKIVLFFVIKSLDPELDPDPNWPKMLEPARHWNQCEYRKKWYKYPRWFLTFCKNAAFCGNLWQWLLVSVPDTLMMIRNSGLNVVSSDGDPDPEPNPHVFGPRASGSLSQRYWSGSESFLFPIKMLSGLKLCLKKKINKKF